MSSDLLPRRSPGRGDQQVRLLAEADRVDVHDQVGLLAVPPDQCPVLCGDGVFALGHGSVARARDAARVCVVEGAALLFRDEVSVVVWEGGAAAGMGAAVAEVGSGGWLWLVAGPDRPAHATAWPS